MDDVKFPDFLAKNILEYIVWRENHAQNGNIRLTIDSPFFYFRNTYPEDALFPISASIELKDEFSPQQSKIIEEIWQIIETTPLAIVFFQKFEHPLITFFIQEVTLQSGQKKLRLIDGEWISDEKILELEVLINRYPNYLFLHQAKFLNRYANRDYEEAKKQLEIIFSLDKDNIMYLCRYSRLMAEALFNKLRPGGTDIIRVEKSLKKAIKLLGDQADNVTFIHAWLGLVYSKCQQYKKALPLIERTIELNTFHGVTLFEPYFWKAKTLYNLGKIEAAFEILHQINERGEYTRRKIESPNKKKLFEKFDTFVQEMEVLKHHNDFEAQYAEIILEEILYRRDLTSKDWGHIYGKTTVYSYRRLNNKKYWLELPFKNFRLLNFHTHSSIFCKERILSKEQTDYIKKYRLNNFEMFITQEISEVDENIFPLISTLLKWHKSHYIRSSIDLNLSKKYPIILFLYALSIDIDYENNYYFPYAEYLEKNNAEKYLLEYYSHDSENLFANIALMSLYAHSGKIQLAKKFALKARYLDPGNPWVLGKLALIYQSTGENEFSLLIMNKLINTIPDEQWVRDWFAKILIDNGLYSHALLQIDEYDRITENGYKTFEPYLWKAIALFNLGRYSEIPAELKKSEYLYFGEGYQYRLDELKSYLRNK